MLGKSARQKGKLLEDYVADQIVAHGLDPHARRDGGSGNGNREKGDIVTSMTIFGQNAGIECKNQKSLAIPEWWRQAQKLESLGREPILAFKQFGEPMEATKVVIYLDTFLRLVKHGRENVIEIKTAEPEDRETKYALEQLKSAIHRVQKKMGW